MAPPRIGTADEVHPERNAPVENDERTHPATTDPHQPGLYEIRLKGHLDRRWAAWFDGLSLGRETDGTSIIRGPVADQAALHGLLQKVRDTGLPLVSVICVERDPADGQTDGPP
jgi:hypothetical protein